MFQSKLSFHPKDIVTPKRCIEPGLALVVAFCNNSTAMTKCYPVLVKLIIILRFMVKPHTSDIRVYTSHIRMTYEYI